MKNLLTNLPEDVFINNILLSKVLPIKSLLSLRCVCKYLQNLITSPAFINMQISKELNNNNNNTTLVLLKATNRPDAFFSLKFNGDYDPCGLVEFVSPIEGTSIWGSCNGLVCLANRGNVCLWNPSTKEYKILPPPLPSTVLELPIGRILGSITYGFGYDRLLDDYKVIRCTEHFVGRYNHRIPITEFQVYTLGTNTWTKISTHNNPYKSYYFVLSSFPSSVVFANGALHWIMSTSSSLLGIMSTSNSLLGKLLGKSLERPPGAEAKIVSLDIEKEVFREIQTPLMANLDLCFCPEIQVLRGCLCVLELDTSTKSFCNVWMMMNYGKEESWTKLFTILRSEVSMSSSYRILRFCENGTDILLVESYDSLMVYDPINNKARRVEFGEFRMCMYESEIYIESLVSLNSGVYMDEKRVSKLVTDFGYINLD